VIAKATGTVRGPAALLARLHHALFARRRAREEAEDAEDLAIALDRLRNPEGPPIPWEQVKRDLGIQ